MVFPRLIKVVNHHIEIVMRADDLDALLARDLAELRVRNLAPGGLALVITELLQLAKALPNLLGAAHLITNSIKLHTQFLYHINLPPYNEIDI